MQKNNMGLVALYIPSLAGGGAERMAISLAKGLATRSLSVDLVLAKAEGPYLDEALPGVRVVDLGARNIRTSVLAQTRYVPALTKYLRGERPHAMLSIMNHANVIALAARRLADVGTRLVVSEHNNLSASRERGLAALGARRGPIMPWVMRHTYPWADRVVAVSRGVADDLSRTIKLPREMIDVIHNPVVGPQMLSAANAPLDHSWFEPGQPPVVLGVGRLIQSKRFDVLLRAFAKLREAHPARLLIIGEGEHRPALEALIDDLGLRADVSLPGFQSNPYPYMRRAALFVLSSAHEGFGNVLVEAMACGTPVVSTDCPSGPAEILEDGKWGRLVPVGDADALADAMSTTLVELEHPNVIQRAQDFTIERAVDRYRRVLIEDTTG